VRLEESRPDAFRAVATKKREESGDGPLMADVTAAVKKMLARGRRRGWVTYDEVNAALPPDQVSSDQIESVMAQLSEMGINVVETAERPARYDATVSRIDDLERLPGVSVEAIAELRRLVAEGLDEAKVVAAFLRLLAEGRVPATLDRQTKRAIRRLARDVSVPDGVVRRVWTRLTRSFGPEQPSDGR